MLWSLTKILVFVVIVSAIALGAGWLLETSGGIQITVAGTEFTLGPLQSVIALCVLLLTLWLVLKLASFLVALLRFVNGDETALSRYFDRNRERKGYAALSEGLMALASGEGKVAMSKAAKAERYLQRPDLTNLLTAQAAEVVGDAAKAEETYKKLVTDERTRFVGVRGIMKQKLSAGDTDTALKLAERAFAIKPKHEETQDILLQLQAQGRDWSGARKTLNTKLKTGTLPRDIHRRRDAVLAMVEGQEALENNNTAKAREEFVQANKLSPDFVPAAVAAARSLAENNQKRAATRIIKKAWTVAPHPDLAAAFGAIEPEETPDARLRRFEPLLRQHADHPEAKMTRAELNIARENFPEARRALGKLVEDDPTVRSLTILAAIERGEGADDAIVRGWLTRALSASRGPQWICDVCNTVAAAWTPICEVCGGFDTLTWRTAAESEQGVPSSTDMLPLLVGSPNEATNDTVTIVEDAEVVENGQSGDANNMPEEPTAKAS